MENVQIKENERIDDLQIKDYRIIQKTDGFCFGIDAVLLSDYARVKKKSKGIDLCSGTGIIPILMEGKYPLAHVEGLEYQEEFAKMAERSVKMNGQEEKVHIVQGDVRNIKTDYERESFDWVTCFWARAASSSSTTSSFRLLMRKVCPAKNPVGSDSATPVRASP